MYSFALILPAAGSGSRFGSDLPKPFVELGSQSILWHTISAFLEISGLRQIIIARNPEFEAEVMSVINALEIPVEICVEQVDGGSERQFSINNALQKVADDIELVAVHDAVRPFPDPKAVQRTLEAAQSTGAALMGHPPRDTIKIARDDKIHKTLTRSELIQCQTPQVFERNLIQHVYKQAVDEQWMGTDDASLAELAGHEVQVVMGNVDNIKITYPYDLLLAEQMLKQRTNNLSK